MPKKKLMTKEEREVIRSLRDRGYAIIIWAPEELAEADPGQVQDRSIEIGWDVIRDLNGHD